MTHPAGSTSTRALGGALAGLLDVPVQVATALGGSLLRRSSLSCCEIPPPCWEPRHAGTCCLELTPGSSATMRVHLSNCGWSRQLVAITALGKLAGWMSFSPTTLLLDPQETATFLVTVHVPDKVPFGQRISGPLIVRGCVNHFARVEITVSDCVGRNCCDIMVDDCADNVHHWYDHFYCPRPCQNIRGRDPAGGGVKDG